MKLNGAIDLHSTNNVTVVIDEQDRVVYQKRSLHYLTPLPAPFKTAKWYFKSRTPISPRSQQTAAGHVREGAHFMSRS